jgi:superfamily II DNA or RNA helicase
MSRAHRRRLVFILYPSPMGSLEKLLETLSSEPHVKGRQFELLARWFLTNSPEHASMVEKVWLWDEWPGRWGADAGIDLVVKTRHDTLWAIQAKAYDPDYSVTKRDLDSFLSESSRPDFEYRLLMATTDHIGGTASRTLAAQEKPVGSLMLADLEASVIGWPDSIDDLRPATTKRATPRPHQREAIDAAIKGLKEHDRGKVVMACGTGKTYVGLWLHEELGSDLTLVLVPSLSLLKQTLREWTTHRNTDFDYLAICSDETVDRDERSDSFVASTTALGVPVTTDAGDIGRFLRASRPRVVFSTYQSSPRLAEAMAATPGVRFDLGIADEAHRCTGPATSAFSTVLDDTLIPARKRIFMTATPRYYTGRVLRKAGERDLDIASMDNEDAFGPDFYTLLFAEAIEKGLLSDYRILVVGVNNAMYREYAERGDLVTFDGDRITDARTLAREVGLAKAMKKYELKRVLTFHSRVKGAEDFSKELPAVISWMPDSDSPTDAVACDFVSGKMNAGDREVRLRRLRTLDQTDRVVLSSARCLAEGVDVPGIDGVAFIDPRRSQVDVVQAVGRALRLSEDKTAGTVVISVFVDDDEDAEAAAESSEFEPVWQVVKALRSHDSTIGEWLDQLRAINADGRTPITVADLPDRIEVDLPIDIGVDFTTAFASRLVVESTSSWQVGFGYLSDYAALVGHTIVPASHKEQGFNLGMWVANRRNEYRTGKLTSERITLLESLPGWVWKLRTRTMLSFDEWFGRLEQFVSREKHSRISYNYLDGDLKLGAWVKARRLEYKNGGLPSDKIAHFNRLEGWEWEPGSNRIDVEEAFSRLDAFASREGHVRVPPRHVEQGFKLGSWIAQQRSKYSNSTLNSQTIARLEQYSTWVWRKHLDAIWNENYALLKEYADREGHVRIPRHQIINTVHNLRTPLRRCGRTAWRKTRPHSVLARPGGIV